MSKYTSGQVIEVAGYPFVRDVFENHEFDEGGISVSKIHGWKPGCNQETDEYESDFVADGLGEMILVVVSTHKPGGFPERVFYTRQWRDPDGRVFGADKKLRVIATAAFTRLTRGYRHNFEVVE